MILSKIRKLGNINHKYNLRSVIKNPVKTIKKKYKRRKDQRKFRDKLIKRYDSKCALLGIHASLCDAAHIFPHCECKTNNEKYDENNGILLSATLHKAYDKDYFWIDENSCEIKINYEKLKQDNIEDLKAVGLDGFEDYYIEELDNKTTREYLKRRNSSIRK